MTIDANSIARANFGNYLAAAESIERFAKNISKF